MPIHALIATIRTRPEPAILPNLHGLDEEFTHFIRRRLRVPMFTHHHQPQLLLVPPRHIILPLLLLLLLLPRIRVQIPLLALPAHIQIVAELALLALLAAALLVELAQHRLRVDAEGHFLDLHGLEKLGGFALGSFGGGFFALAGGLLRFFAFLFGGFGVGGLGLDGLDLFLGGAAFFLWERGAQSGVWGLDLESGERIVGRLVVLEEEGRKEGRLTFFMPNV